MKGQIRELLTQYGQIDMLWYDGGFFTEKLTPETLGSPSINTMARQLQPGILINERSGSPEDFSCCENECRPSPRGRDWEMCICINDIWGYCEHDYNYKTVNQLIFLLANCASQGGNLLLNVGPRPDGSIPADGAHHSYSGALWCEPAGDGENHRCKSDDSLQAAEKIPL
jgi:alpha-L-fucosidase